jgi:hypothetical protein
VTDLVRVSTVENKPEAELAVGLQRIEGISAMWQRAAFGAAGAGLGSAGGVSGPFDVLVEAQDAERAGELSGPSQAAPEEGPPPGEPSFEPWFRRQCATAFAAFTIPAPKNDVCPDPPVH